MPVGVNACLPSPVLVPLPLHERAPKILFGCELIVGATTPGEVPRALVATPCVRVHVVQLEKPGFSASPTSLVDKGAALAITIRYLAPHPRRRRHALARSVCTLLACERHCLPRCNRRGPALATLARFARMLLAFERHCLPRFPNSLRQKTLVVLAVF